MDESALAKSFFNASFWDKAGLWALYLLGLFLPLWVLPITSNPLYTNKIALSYFLIIFSFLCWLIGRINSGSVVLPKNYLALALVLMPVVWAVSGVFSVSPHVSFFELSEDPSGFFAVIMFVLAAYIAYFYLNSSEKVFLWFSFFFTSAFLVFVFQFLRVFLGFNVFAGINFPSAVSNLFGSWTEFAVFFSLTGLLAVFLFETLSETRLRWIFLSLYALSFAVLASAGNNLVWRMSLVFLLITAAYLFSLKPRHINIFRAVFLAILLTLLFMQVPALSSAVVSYLGTGSIEVRPSWPSSWAVVQKTLEGNPVLGSGPATFVYDWMRFKPLAVNESVFWATRFSSGVSFAVSVLATTGVMGFFAFLFVIISFLYYAAASLIRSGQNKFNPVFIMVLMGVCVLLAYSFVGNMGFVLTLFLFLFLGMFMALVSEYGFSGEYKVALFQSSGSGFISALVIIFLIMVSFSGFYIFGQKYAGAYFFGKASALSASGDVPGARLALERAVSFDRRDYYLRLVTEINLGQMAELLNRGDLTSEDLRGSFQDVLSQSIQSAQNAVSLNPADSLNFMSLGRVYESVIPFKIAGASDFASASYIEAGVKNPTSPEPFLARARVALALNQLDEARNMLEESLKIKNSYTPAYFLLAQIEDAQGNTVNAIRQAEAAAVLGPNDLGALFQLGFLYYRSDRLNDSKIIFERAVSISPNYSNARYFLGLIYDRLGDKESASGQFEQILAFNPGNKEVQKILDNLRAGKKALTGITPPPEERREPPIKE
ncbi:MAG: hypothetical protein A2931_04070 [Candidatus Niyogibacteria bacterium RIFCSPLOWO2_01_FULL_45_48]|uniref:Uncharacterized protein n=2 Tax=Candidatus Niyogiibacteriota TaxID=1817912 RepID=A0A1G2EZQ3_9BACT|nr:MAG: hypothetical protein A2835_02020 [Candidatus Niyogibacteria bacterium RIFCSPHIGHO2_01_FULL_45_28]OGZ30599.1 MAG: hypothetical protein A2931_04070 [Candidatus Niyogibacteria bacterium RIFCSPLOWO2_01_FULL_45_48]OGZ31223.1 MAG: hypothetical protein A3J00_01605 [Candidatus Niyogibacteria bacterium RIFCSPLOWO2_02_FULL_45_13]